MKTHRHLPATAKTSQTRKAALSSTRRILTGSIAAACALAFLGGTAAQAVTYYWDTNSTTLGFGTTAGTWGTSLFWGTVVGGTGATANTTILATDDVNFGTVTDGLTGAAAGVAVTGAVNVHNITFGSASSAVTLSGGTSITLGGATPTITVNNTLDTISSIIAGAAGLVKSGTGTLVLSGINTYTGATTVSQGTLTLSGARTVATGGTYTVGSLGNSATLNISLGTHTLATSGFIVGTSATGGVTGTVNQTGGTVTFTPNGNNGMLIGNGAATGIYNLSAGTLSSSGTVSTTRGIMLGVNDNANATFNLSGTGILTNAGGILMVGRSDTALTGGTTNTVAYNQTGGTATTASLTIGGKAAGTNTINATFSVTGGSFSATLFPTLSPGNNNTSTLTIGGTATVTLPAIPTARGTSSSASITFDSSAGGYLRPTATSATYMPAGTFSTAKLTANGARFDTNAFDITIGQVFQDNTTGGTLTKLGAGALTLSGANTYTGNTTISAGTLNLGSAESANVSGPIGKQLANAAGTILMTGGTLQYSASNSNDYSGRFSTAGSQAWNIDTNSQAVTFATALQGASTLTKSGAGTLTLPIANSYSGATAITGGTLVAGNVAAFGTTPTISLSNGTTGGSLQLSTDTSVNAYAIGGSSGAGAGTIVSDRATAGAGITHVLGAAVLGSNTYNFTKGTNVTSGTAAISLASVNMAAGTAGTVILNPTTADLQVLGAVNIGSGNNPKTLQLDGTSLGSSISGAISNGLNTLTVTKLGTGIWTLSGNNSYTGTTTVSGGTLVAASSASTTTGNIIVGNAAANAVLNVTGTMTGGTITAGTLAGSAGAVNVTGGTLTLATPETTDTISFGTVLNAYGAFTISSGTFTQQRFMFGGIGGAATGGTGVGLITGGTVVNTGWTILARSGPTDGTLTITGGQLNRSSSIQDLAVGLQGTGRAELNVAGGLINNTGRRVDFSGGTTGVFHWSGTGIVNLNAGTLLTDSITYDTNVGSANASSYVNFSGGTLKASTSTASFLSAFTPSGTGVNRVFVNGAFGTFAGGAVIDTNGFDDTIGADLLAPTGNGVTSLSLDNAGSGYIGAPAVKILDGGLPSTATGYAVVGIDSTNLATFGKITSVVITNPGVITGAATVSLLGGGGTGAAISVASTGVNTSGGLTKEGSGTLTLTGTSTYSGATQITGGALALSGTGAINGSSGITINGSGAKFVQGSTVTSTPGITLTQGTLTGSGTVGGVGVANSVSAIISNNNGVSGASLTTGNLTFNGAATVNLFSDGVSTSALVVASALSTNAAGTVTINPTAAAWTNGSTYDLISYTGGSILGAGFGQFALGTVTGLNSRQTASGLSNSGTAVTFGISGFDAIWTSATGTTEWSTAVLANPKNWTLTGGGGITDFVTSDAVIFNDSAAIKTVDISNGDLSPNVVTFTNTTGNDYTLTGANGITGTAALNKTGSGMVTINNTNSFTGGTNITNGTLVLGHATDTLANTGAVTLNGATAILSIGANSDTVGLVSLKNGASITGSGGTLTGSSYAVESGSISSILGGAGIVLNKTTSGTVTLSGVNTYTGATNITTGTLKLSGAGSIATSSGVLVSAGATLDLNGTNQTITLGASAGTIANNSGGGTSVLTFNGTANSGSPLIVDSTSNPGGNVAVVVTASSQNFNVANTYSGGTTVNGGAFFYLGSAGTQAGTGTITLSASTSGLLGNGITIANDISGAGYIGDNVNGAATITLTGTLNTSGIVTFRNAANVYDFAGSGNSTLSGSIGTLGGTNGTSSAGRIIKSGSGTLTLSGASIYTGTTTISAGTLKLGAAGSGANTPLGTTAAGTLVTGTGTLDLAGFTLVTAEALSLAGTGTSSSGALANSGGAATYGGLLTLTGNASIVATGNIILANAGTITGSGFGLTLDGTATGSSIASIIGTGAGTLTKTGNGTWSLAIANTFTGATTVNGGNLALNLAGAIANSATNTVTVNNGGTLTFGAASMWGNYVQTAAPLTPLVVNAGGTVTNSGNFTTPLGLLTLNGATLTNIGGSNVPLLGGYVFKGTVTVGGTSGSFISGTANNTLGSGTAIMGATFDVGVTGATTDLTVSTFLSNGFSAGSTAQASFLTKTGLGTMALSGANTYTGVTTVKQGSLVLFGGNNRLVSNGSVIIGDTGSTGKLVLGDASAAINQQLASLTATGLGGSVVGANATTNSVLTISTAGTVTYAGTLGGAGTNENMLALTKAGAGTLTLSNTNTHTGNTTVSAGTLGLTNGAAIADTGRVILADVASAMLLLNNSETIGALTGGGATGGTVALGANTLTFGDATAALTYSGAITGATGTLVKQGAGAVTLDGVQTYGTLTTSNGLTNVNSVLVTGTSTVNANGGTTNFGVSQTLAALNIADGAVVTLGAPAAAPAPEFGGAFGGGETLAAAAGVAAVPEPGSATLFVGGVLTLLGVRRRSNPFIHGDGK